MNYIHKLTTDDGLTGISETYGGDGPRAALEAARDRAVGMDPFRLVGLYQLLNQHVAVSGNHSQTYLARAKTQPTSTRERLRQSSLRAWTSSEKRWATRYAT